VERENLNKDVQLVCTVDVFHSLLVLDFTVESSELEMPYRVWGSNSLHYPYKIFEEAFTCVR